MLITGFMRGFQVFVFAGLPKYSCNSWSGLINGAFLALKTGMENSRTRLNPGCRLPSLPDCLLEHALLILPSPSWKIQALGGVTSGNCSGTHTLLRLSLGDPF
jgi:hypothetical protein